MGRLFRTDIQRLTEKLLSREGIIELYKTGQIFLLPAVKVELGTDQITLTEAQLLPTLYLRQAGLTRNPTFSYLYSVRCRGQDAASEAPLERKYSRCGQAVGTARRHR